MVIACNFILAALKVNVRRCVKFVGYQLGRVPDIRLTSEDRIIWIELKKALRRNFFLPKLSGSQEK